MEQAAKTPRTLDARASQMLTCPVIATIIPVEDYRVEPSNKIGNAHQTKTIPSKAKPITLYLELK